MPATHKTTCGDSVSKETGISQLKSVCTRVKTGCKPTVWYATHLAETVSGMGDPKRREAKTSQGRYTRPVIPTKLRGNFSVIAMGATFEGRYFVPLFWALLILCGLDVGTVWDYLFQNWKRKNIAGFSAIAVYVCVSLWFSVQMAQLERNTQLYVYEASLKQIGIWLKENTPVSSTVLLEPLGYAGYYADRYMIDEVGLISPQVVDWKSAGYSTDQVISFLDPDYVVLHCDDVLRASDAFLSRYANVAAINPLGFDPEFQPKYDPTASEWVRRNISRPRSACYQLWKR